MTHRAHRPDLPDRDDVDGWLRRMWMLGAGIGQTRIALRRQGHDIAPADIRIAFVRFAQEVTPTH